MPPGRAAPVFVLASESPRRRDLLAQVGLVPDLVDPPAIDETIRPRERPEDAARRLALAKLAAVAPRHRGAWILAADTIVACGRRILPKPADQATARACLALLSGRRHRVIGAVAVAAPDGRVRVRVVRTIVTVKRLAEGEMRRYLASGEWRGKAGGYAIQGRAASFVKSLNGSYSNVVGLPVYETCRLLEGLGFAAWPEDCDVDAAT